MLQHLKNDADGRKAICGLAGECGQQWAPMAGSLHLLFALTGRPCGSPCAQHSPVSAHLLFMQTGDCKSFLISVTAWCREEKTLQDLCCIHLGQRSFLKVLWVATPRIQLTVPTSLEYPLVCVANSNLCGLKIPLLCLTPVGSPRQLFPPAT